jgi:hypothetical protein
MIDIREATSDALVDVELPRSLLFKVLAVVGATRIPVLLLGVAAVLVIGTTPPQAAEASWRVSANEVHNLLARWDTAFYYAIATKGYDWSASSVFRHQNVAFYPLYPLLMRWGGVVLGGRPLLAGLIVSLASFAGAVALLYRLAVLEVGERDAWPVILLFAAYPFALFYSTVYTESLFLLATVGAFYAMRRGHLSWVAVAGLAAGLTRPNGSWLAAPLLWMAVTAGGADAAGGADGADGAAGDATGRVATRRVAACLAALTPILGALLYSGYLFTKFGDALASFHAQAAWGIVLLGRPGAPDPIRTGPDAIVHYTEILTWTGNIEAFILAAVSIRPIIRRWGIPYGLWIGINILPPVPLHLFLSLGRFTAVLFPMFFWLATSIPRAKLTRVVILFGALQGMFAIWFFLWRPVV